MKRSDVIDIILGIYLNDFSDQYDIDDKRILVSEIIDTAESIGMIPLYHRSNKQPISQCRNRNEILKEFEDRSDITFDWDEEEC